MAVTGAFDVKIHIPLAQRVGSPMNRIHAVKALLRRGRDGRLTADDCRLLVSVSAAQAIGLVAVSCASIRGARRALARLRPIAVALSGRPTEPRVVWALETSGRWLGGRSTCLGRALAAELLLDSIDQPVKMVIGVAAPIDGRMQAHAWIERGGRVLVGGDQSRSQYVPLIAWSRTTP